jgi:hypothetical protein
MTVAPHGESYTATPERSAPEDGHLYKSNYPLEAQQAVTTRVLARPTTRSPGCRIPKTLI